MRSNAPGWWLCPPTPVPVIRWKGAPYVERLRYRGPMLRTLLLCAAMGMGMVLLS